MKDPDKMLEEIRTLVAGHSLDGQGFTSIAAGYYALAEVVQELDEHLTNGGHLPFDWFMKVKR